jgi:hypothetical protein
MVDAGAAALYDRLDATTELRRTGVVLGGFLARCGECLLLRA